MADVMVPLQLAPSEFEQIRRVAYDLCGLNLRDGKQDLVLARLGRVLRRHGLNSFADYHRFLLSSQSAEVHTEFINALTINHTQFLREPAHFRFLEGRFAAEWSGRPSVRIWSSACSTGEEPYSIVFSLLDAARNARSSFRVLATDIDTDALGAAQKGIYQTARLGDLPQAMRQRFLLRGYNQWEDHWRIKPEVRDMIEFGQLNLTRPFGQLGSFEAIFCRNVMIYFDRDTQQGVVERLSACLAPGGYLLVGHAESLSGIRHPLRYVAPAIYQRDSGGASDGPARGHRATSAESPSKGQLR